MGLRLGPEKDQKKKTKQEWQTTAAVKAVFFVGENTWRAVKKKLQEPDFK